MNKVQLIVKEMIIETKLIHYEGELMEVLSQDFHALRIGDFVTCIYLGKFLEARIIHKKDAKISLFVPSIWRDPFKDRRTYPRIETKIPALLISESVTLPVTLVDFSYQGFGVFSKEDTIELHCSYHLIIQSEILFISPLILICNWNPSVDGARYGGEIEFITHTDLVKLRGYLMFYLLTTSYSAED